MHIPQPKPQASQPERSTLKTNWESHTVHTRLKSASVRVASWAAERSFFRIKIEAPFKEKTQVIQFEGQATQIPLRFTVNPSLQVLQTESKVLLFHLH